MTFYVPNEWGPQKRIWAAAPRSDRDIWGDLLPAAQEEHLAIIATIAKYVPVTLLVAPCDLLQYQGRNLPNVTLLSFEYDDIWMRDAMPTFAKDQNGKTVMLDWNFNTWGGHTKYGHQVNDETLGKRLAEYLGYKWVQMPICAEGSATMTYDGEGTVITTESCLLHPDRNPGATKESIERVFREYCGWEKTIWLPGREEEWEPDTHGHIDGIAFYSNPGQVVIGVDAWEEDGMSAMIAMDIHYLNHAQDVHGKRIDMQTVINPRYEYFPKEGQKIDDFCTEYANGLMVNGAFLMPESKDPKQAEAIEIFQKIWPDREIVTYPWKYIGMHAGGLHCMTQNEPE